MPYNDSIFKLRNKYHSIFPDDCMSGEDHNHGEVKEGKIICKIKYTLNQLPDMGT